MTTEIRIRRATPSDAPLVLDFTRKLAAFERRLDHVRATVDDLAQALDSGKIEAAFALRDDRPIGYIVYYEKFSTFRGAAKLYLEDIFVDPAMRGRGVGVALMRFFAREAIARGCASLEWQVLGWNEPAMAFYRRLGAAPCHDWENWEMATEVMVRLGSYEVP